MYVFMLKVFVGVFVYVSACVHVLILGNLFILISLGFSSSGHGWMLVFFFLKS